MLRVSEPIERHHGPIMVADIDDNHIADFFHKEHATVPGSYETALQAASLFVDAHNQSRRGGLRAQDFDHLCSNEDCCAFGQRTRPKSCLCHVSREDMMLREIARLRNADPGDAGNTAEG